VLTTLTSQVRRGHVAENTGGPGNETPEERVLVSGRVRASVRRRLKRHAAETDESLQDVMDAALDEYLTRRNV
jgi:hypothetical protein